MYEPIRNTGLQNWIKACLGLKCVRDGMLPFVNGKCENLYSDNETYATKLCTLTSYSCSYCTVTKVKPRHTKSSCPLKSKGCACNSKTKQVCPNGGSCGVLYDRIMDDHVMLAPRWDNSDCPKWYMNGWEQMKCFIGIPGYKDTELSQADVTAFVHICQNNETINKTLKPYMKRLEKVRSDRNEICHSGEMTVTDDKLKEYINDMREVLKLPVFNAFKEEIQVQLDTLTKLETAGDFVVDWDAEIEARKEALNAIVVASKTLQERMNTTTLVRRIKRELAQLTVVQDKHMKVVADWFMNIKSEMQKIYVKYNNMTKALKEQSKDFKSIISEIATATTTIESLKRELVHQTDMLQIIEVNTTNTKEIVTENKRTLHDVADDVKTLLLILNQVQQQNDLQTIVPARVTAEITGVTNEGRLSSEVVKRIRNIIQNSGAVTGDETEECLRNIVNQIKNVVGASNGSVVIEIQCPSLIHWITLCEKCLDNSLTQLFKPLQDHLRSRPECEHLTITVDMYETDFVESVDSILKTIHPKLMGMLPNDFENRNEQPERKVMKLDVMLRFLLQSGIKGKPSGEPYTLIKAWLAMDIAKTGLETFLDDEFKALHTQIMQKVRSRLDLQRDASCTHCSIANLLKCPTDGICKKRGRTNCKSLHDTQWKHHRPCPLKICDEVRDEIKREHRYGLPSWTNTTAELWASDHWQILKCFLPVDAYTEVCSIQDMDFNGVINVMVNCKHFESIVSSKVIDSVEPMLKQRTSETAQIIVHCTDDQLHEIITTLSKLLNESNCLGGNSQASDTVAALKKLQSEQNVRVTSTQMRKLLKNINDSLKAIYNEVNEICKKEEQVSLTQALNEVKTYADECTHKLQTNSAKSSTKDDSNYNVHAEELFRRLSQCHSKLPPRA